MLINIGGLAVKSTRFDVGDLIVFPIEGGWVVGVVVKNGPTVAAWGDCERVIPDETGLVAHRSQLLPSAGQLIGRWFSSPVAARDALAVHLIRGSA